MFGRGRSVEGASMTDVPIGRDHVTMLWFEGLIHPMDRPLI
jgi:hypothetical protein